MSKRFENMVDKSSVSKERIGHTYEISMKSTIKKRIFIIFLIVAILLLLILFLFVRKEAVHDLEFPKTAWGISAEEVFDSYGISQADVSRSQEAGRGSMFTIEGKELFGEKTSEINFQFLDFGDNGDMGLCYVRVIYPEGADMNHVLEKMREVYGKTVSDVSIYEQNSALGNETIHAKDYRESDVLKIWSDKCIADFISDKESESYRNLWAFFQPGLNEENWGEFCETARMVTVLWNNDDWKTLEFNAYNLCVYNELKNQLSELPL